MDLKFQISLLTVFENHLLLCFSMQVVGLDLNSKVRMQLLQRRISCNFSKVLFQPQQLKLLNLKQMLVT